MKPPVDFAPFYPIVDVAVGESEERPLALVDALLAAGAPWLQLRCKSSPASAFLALARTVVGRAEARGARVVVNDRVDVALASGAAGVHVGQDDLPLAAVRTLAGELVVGVSTHTLEEAVRAEAEGADYVGFGPIFATASKRNALAPRPPDALRAVRAAIALPIVAIGGITEATAASVLASGATSVAMIGALASARDPRLFAQRLLRRRT